MSNRLEGSGVIDNPTVIWLVRKFALHLVLSDTSRIFRVNLRVKFRLWKTP
jgi:hypothetical protein